MREAEIDRFLSDTDDDDDDDDKMNTDRLNEAIKHLPTCLSVCLLT